MPVEAILKKYDDWISENEVRYQPPCFVLHTCIIVTPSTLLTIASAGQLKLKEGCSYEQSSTDCDFRSLAYRTGTLW